MPRGGCVHHFTSPIRALSGDSSQASASRSDGVSEAQRTPRYLRTCSEQERKANTTLVRRKGQAGWYYQSRLGEETWGTIDGCERLAFITLDDTYADGLLAVRDLGHEWYVYDQETHEKES